jgi:excinuclease UvrABC ATPase subunit
LIAKPRSRWMQIRTLFAETDQAQRRGLTASTFSFNVKGGRCKECAGEGTITTQLSFMPDVEVLPLRESTWLILAVKPK